MGKYKYNYAFVMYDVNEKRVQKVFKICKKYFIHYQKSIFRGNITPSKMIKFKAEIRKVIEKNEDYVAIISLVNDKCFEQEELGIINDSESIFI